MKELTKIDPEVRNALAQLVARATDPDESRRQAVVSHLLQSSSPELLSVLAYRLGEVFARDRVPVRRQAAASLSQLGAPAVSALLLAFVATDRTLIKHEAAQLLEEIGRRLSQQERRKLIDELTRLREEARDDTVRQNLMGVMMALAWECVNVRIARQRAKQAAANGPGPMGEQERPGGAADGRTAE